MTKLDHIAEIYNKLETAKANGIAYPILRLDTHRFSLAPDTGRNAGWVYVKRNDTEKTYVGKINKAGEFHGGFESRDYDEKALAEIGKNVQAAATAYGQRTGQCSCCGRQLTNEESINLAIGPICREKWGM